MKRHRVFPWVWDHVISVVVYLSNVFAIGYLFHAIYDRYLST